MLIDTRLTLAYKCHYCGTFEYSGITLFSIAGGRYAISCRCGQSELCITEPTSGHYDIRLQCSACGQEHIYHSNHRDMLYRDINAFKCPNTGMQQLFAGRDDEIRRRIDSIEKEQDELIDCLGYERYFKNTRVMMDTLNMIHDIAAKGNLFCECGNDDVEVTLFPDCIFLKCRKCPGSMIVSAESNNDLKKILSYRHILLVQKLS